MPSIADNTPRVKNTFSADPVQSADFDQALKTVHSKYTSGEPLTRRELAALITSATRLMKEAE